MERLIDSFRKFARAGDLLARSFIVGGSVRDILTGQKPKDLDIAIAGDAIKTARSFAGACGGTFVLLDGRFGAARVARGPEHVDFARIRGRDIQEDLSKRDLTINAMAIAMDRERGRRPGSGRRFRSVGRLIDPLGGAEDLSRRVIRVVAENNLVEDPLRVLRAYRFSAQLGFRIEDESARMLKKLAPLLAGPAPERVTEEMRHILSSRDSRRVLEMMRRDGALRAVLPGAHSRSLQFVRAFEGARFKFPHARKFDKSLRPFALKLALLTFGSGERGLSGARLVLSNRESDYIEKILGGHMKIRRAFDAWRKNKTGSGRTAAGLFMDLGDFIYPSLLASYCFVKTSEKGAEFLAFAENTLSFYLEAMPRMERRLITGDDLRDLGLAPGPAFKEILRRVGLMRLKGKLKTKKAALAEALKLVKKVSV